MRAAGQERAMAMAAERPPRPPPQRPMWSFFGGEGILRGRAVRGEREAGGGVRES